MPNGIFPVPPGSSGFGLRLKVWARRDRLDEELARAADPTRTPELELRAKHLSSATQRAELAEALENIVRQAHGTPPGFTVRLALRRAEVRRTSDDLLFLARRLREDAPVEVQGVAMASRLLHDPASPLYERAARFSLEHAARSARLALDPHGLVDAAPSIAA
jgi:hypothetical protein